MQIKQEIDDETQIVHEVLGESRFEELEEKEAERKQAELDEKKKLEEQRLKRNEYQSFHQLVPKMSSNSSTIVNTLKQEVNEARQTIADLQEDLYNALLEMEGHKWDSEESRKALEAKDLKLKFTEKEKNTHERRVNTMKTLLEVMVQTRRVQDLKILELEKELEDKNRVIMELKTSPPGIPQNNIPVSQIPLPTPESSPPRETMSLSTIQTLASRIENFRQMRQNGNAGSQSRPSRRSRPY